MDVDTKVDHTKDQKLAPHHAAGHASTHGHHHTATHDLSLARGPQLQAQPPVQESPAPSPKQAPMTQFKADTSAADGKSGGSVPSSGLAPAPSPELHIPLPKQQEKKAEPAQEKAKGDKGKEKGFVSRGWKIHNEVTYRGIDWVLNSIVGVTTAFWSSRTESGEKWFAEPVSKRCKQIISLFVKSEESQNLGAKWGSAFVSIIVGGFAIIPLMMVMENKNNKKKMVRALDTWMYGEETVKNDPKFEESYKKIDEEPKKGFLIGMGSRLLTLLPIVMAVFYEPSNRFLIKYLYDPIGDSVKWGATKIGLKPGEFMKKGALEHIEGNSKLPKRFQSNWDFMFRTIGFDFGLTFIYSFLHEVAYKSLAALGLKEHKEESQTQNAASNAITTKQDMAIATTKEEPAPAKWSHKLSADEKEKTAERADASWTQRRQNDAALIAAPGIA